MRSYISKNIRPFSLAIIMVIGAIAMIMTAQAPSPKPGPLPQKDGLKILTTFTIIGDMTKQIIGDHGQVISITRPGVDIHNFKPSPKDIAQAQDADLILSNGLNLELWFERFLYDLHDVPRAIITTGITPLSIYEGNYNGKPNPHAWMSPKNGIIYAQNIAQALAKIDPENASEYAQNAAQYQEKLAQIDHDLSTKLNAIPAAQKWLVTSEGAFSYLAKDYGFHELYIWPINADQQGSPQQVKKVIDAIRTHNIPVIFSETTISSRPAKQIAQETGILYGGALYVDSLSPADGPVPDYLSLLKTTTQTIADGFEKALQE